MDLLIFNTPIPERKITYYGEPRIGELVKIDGSWSWWPARKCTKLPAWVLRVIADTLDNLNGDTTQERPSNET